MKLMSARSSLAPGAHVDGEARAGDLGGALEVENAQLGAEVPVGLRFEVEGAGRAPAFDFDVVVGATAYWDSLGRDIRDGRQVLSELLVDGFDLLFEGGGAVAHGAHLGLEFGGVLAGLFELADLLAFGVSAGFELFGFGERGAAADVELPEVLDVEREAAIGEPGGDRVQVGAESG